MVKEITEFPSLTTTERNALGVVPSGTIVLNTTTDQFERWNGSIWESMSGSGGGLGINFLTLDSAWVNNKQDNGNANQSIGDWLAYADAASDAPVDMTGGSPSVTITRTTTVGEVLNGTGSFKITKPASNVQGQGVSCTAYIPLGYRDQYLSFNIPFKVISGSLAFGDLKIFAYDVTNSKVLYPFNNNLIGSTGKLVGSFIVPLTCQELKFGFHFASTSALALSLSFDDIVLGTQPSAVFGMSGTSWIDYPMIITGTVSDPAVGGLGVNKASYREIGDTVEIQYTLKQISVGSIGSGFYLFSLPVGMEIDSSKIDISTGTCIGTAQMESGSNFAIGNVAIYDSTHFILQNDVYANGGTPTGANTTVGAGFLNLGNTDIIYSCSIRVPIVGLSASVVTQSTGPFSISKLLQFGTQVTGVAPVKLGEWRAFTRDAGALTYTDSIPNVLPTAADGFKLYADGSFAAGGTANQPTRYDIFVGKGKHIDWDFWASVGRTGIVDTGPGVQNGLASMEGYYRAYDTTTGVATIWAPLDGGASTHIAGVGIGQSTVYTCYADIYVSETIVPVQSVTAAPVVKQYTANGTYIVPDGLRYAEWEFCGGGAAGGASTASGGGGSGAYCKHIMKDVSPLTSISITIGLGGTSTGASGGDTIIGAPISITAGGGSGGNGVGGAPASAAGGVGGVVTGASSDDIAISGSKGGTGVGNSGIGYMGMGGGTPFFGGGGANGAYPSTSPGAGTAPGAGGGGSYGGTGGFGADGIVIIREYYYI